MKAKFVLSLFIALICSTIKGQNVVINELLTSNTITNTDEDGSYQDWVELYNIGPASVNLNGFGLTDDPTLPYKWVFPNVTMAAGTYLLVWCSDKNLTNPASELHTNFKISASGESVTLTNPGGDLVNMVPATFMISDVSYGRQPNGTGAFVFFSTPTPNAVNTGTSYSEILLPPTFSNDGGFYTAAFNLTISTATPGATILYTLDGSDPDPSNLGGTTYNYKNQYPEEPGQTTGPLLTQSFQTLQYSAPLNIIDRSPFPNKIASISSTMDFVAEYIPADPIFKGNVVRAIVTKPGALPSKSESRTYFVTPEGSSRFTLPVISLSITEKKLYDYDEGIYVAGVDFDTWRAANPTVVHDGIEDIANFYRRGLENERVANMTYFVNGAEVINQDVGLRIHGASSREWQNKSFKIYSRADYGDETMNYAFFPNVPTAFERLILRNSGADFYETLYRDALNMALIKNTNVLTKNYQPTITFMNGEYWGILSLSDKFDDQYFERVFNIQEGQLDVVRTQSTVEEGDNVHYLAMLNYVTNNSLAVPANYNYITTQLDPENFADYFISNIFLQNIDWPGNNIVRWRKKTNSYLPDALYGHDGRWRWLAHDMDATFATRSHNIALNSLAAATATNGPSWPNPAWSTLMLRKMLDNESFELAFINRFADLMNTTFLPSRVVSTIETMADVLEPEILEQIARWDAPSFSDWNSYIGEEVDFANQRPAFQRDHIRSQFGISNNINATLDVSDAAHGYIKLNTINIRTGTDGISANPYPWTGIYFSNIPLTLKAVANPGFVFDHWTGASTSVNEEITITSANAFAVTAVFIPDTSSAANEAVYFWMMDGNIPNDTPLETLASTYETTGINGEIQFQSSLAGYPFTSASPNWRKASMERRNSPTPINYIPEANNDIPFAMSDMKGLQIRQPFQSGGLENTMVFAFSTGGYEDLHFSFAAIDEGAATGISMDYSINAGAPVWTTAGLTFSTFPLTNTYQLFTADLSTISAANGNDNFKVRLRFTGPDMTSDTGGRVTFNNIAVRGTESQLGVIQNEPTGFQIYPNPFGDIINIRGAETGAKYTVYTIEGKLIKSGMLPNDMKINLDELTTGVYVLQIVSNDKKESRKILKN